MTIEITSIDDLTSEDIENKREELIAFIQEKYPNIDISHGVFSSLILELTAIFGAKFEEELNRWKSARSIKAIEEDPTLSDDEAVEHILSNYNVARKSGSHATGSVTLLFSKNISYIIPTGYRFLCNGISFITTQSYAVYSSNSNINDANSLILVPRKEGGYSCNVDVIAETAGSAGCIRKNSELEIVTPITSLIKAYATEDFIGGSDTETNAVMLNRFKSGLATPCWGNRYNIESMIRSETSHITDISVIGCGDVEMTRDQSTLFPVSLGGKTDIYIKTAPYSATDTVTLPASLTNIDGIVYTWSVLIPESSFPGFWKVLSIINEDKEVQGDVIEEVNLSTHGLQGIDCFFTSYQRRIITFTTLPVDGIELYSTCPFDITLTGCPYIDEIQEIVSRDSLKPLSSDVIVRAPIPCDVYITIHLNSTAKEQLAEEQQLAIQQAVASYINNTGFNQPLLVSDILPFIQAELTGNQKVAGVQLDGILLTPSLKLKRLSSNQYIQIPELPSEGVTPRVTAYYTQPERVAFSYNTEL